MSHYFPVQHSNAGGLFSHRNFSYQYLNYNKYTATARKFQRK